ncbi:MAG: RloB domain-containing protein [Bacteroidales bacterium]|nr:MAG: RloB domain-containing protein [Bacteroidales bacterium]
MTNSKRIYSKHNPEKDTLPQKVIKPIDGSILQMPNIEDSANTYQKPSKEISPKAFFVIISGGEVREKDYFKIVCKQDKFKRIKIDFIADPTKLSPKGMLSIAQFKKELYQSSQDENPETPDKIFIVSDVDLFMPELIEISPLCAKDELLLIISNSCFEVWLYYAYCSNLPDFSIPKKMATISWEFKKWLPNAIQGGRGINPTKAVFNIQQNIENAKANYKVDANGIPELFSTNMFELAESMLPLIEPELKRMVEDNRIRESEYRNNHKPKQI